MKQVKGYTKDKYLESFGKTAIIYNCVDEAADAWAKALEHLSREQIIEGFYNDTNCDAIIMDDGTVICYESPEHYLSRMEQKASSIKKARKNAQLSIKQAAELIGVPLRTWENWEFGYRKPSDYVEHLIVDKLNHYVKGDIINNFDLLIDLVCEEAKNDYIKNNGNEAWNNLSNDERFDLGYKVLQKYYDKKVRKYILNENNF